MRGLFALLAVLTTVFAAPQPAAAIAGGEDARTGAYAFSVLLTMTGLPADGGGTRDSSCSGALIAPRWVITAGHCFRDASGDRVSRTVAEQTTAIIGRTDVQSDAGYEVTVVDVHQADHTDVALAELADPVTGITPIPLATASPTGGEVLRLTGFGLLGDGTPARRMQTGLFTVGHVDPVTLEASGRSPRPDTSPCPHDSGGPYFREKPLALVAVVSTGPGCPHPGPDYSARVDNLTDWITDTTADRPLPSYALAAAALLAVVLAAVSRPLLRTAGVDRGLSSPAARR
ncbi:esterase [Actinoplanes sp. OR16]|uniref:S1 family peptidase n=1 Tax=Actinoplanes sp. OR16 TaxID=946334 RepID=UPI000F6CC8CA|nr:S1 family peptidase [Actinoplanes sp. OR16]BBH68539.1 esterase [Actinoplanes sp. OR16]